MSAISAVSFAAVPATGWSQNGVSGVIRAAGSLAPIADAIVTSSGVGGAIHSDAAGRFELSLPGPGTHLVVVRRIGFRPDTLAVAAEPTGRIRTLDVLLVRVPAILDTVPVLPAFALKPPTGAEPSVQLSRSDIARTPQLGDDAFRAVTRVPGVSASDLSAGFRVRGGSNREVLLSLDGMELYEPFHLKDLDGALSIIDPAIVGGASLSTGGFGARYGDHLTGVFALRSRDEAVVKPRGSVSASLSGLGASAASPLLGEHADVLASVRRGFLGAALALAGDGHSLAPRYDDSYARLRVRPTTRDEITLSVLHAGDGLRLDLPNAPSLTSTYGSTYAWATWRTMPLSWLSGHTTVSLARLNWRRDGGETSDPTSSLSVNDVRGFQARSIAQSWTIDAGSRAQTEIGAQIRDLSAQYGYDRVQQQPVVEAHTWKTESSELGTRFDARGTTVGAYVTQHLQVTPALAVEGGVRYDRQSYTGESQVSPRAALSYAIDGRTSLHAAWGRYAQPQSLYELQVEDGVTHFASAERAEHRVIGIDRRVGSGVTVRLEAYERRLLRLDPEYVNLESSFDVFPEAGNDRVLIAPVGGTAKGIELSASSSRGPVQWSASYSLASARDVVNGVSLASPYDQRHSLYADASFSPYPGWRVSAAWQLHSGWPATPITFAVDTLTNGTHHVRAEYGIFNSTRIGPYHRLDFRVSNERRLGSGRLSIYLDVFNVYDRDNPRGLGYTVSDWNAGQAVVVSQRSKLQLPRIPTLGVQWSF